MLFERGLICKMMYIIEGKIRGKGMSKGIIVIVDLGGCVKWVIIFW